MGRVGGLVVYVLGPVPGERARVRIESVKAKYAVAELVAAARPFARPRASRFAPCSARAEAARCSTSVSSTTGLETRTSSSMRWRASAASPMHASDSPVGMRVPRAYRNKMALVVNGGGDASAQFGFYAARSHDLVPIEACPDRRAAARRARWQACGAQPRDPATARCVARRAPRDRSCRTRRRRRKRRRGNDGPRIARIAVARRSARRETARPSPASRILLSRRARMP